MVKKCLAFCGTRTFITAFTTAVLLSFAETEQSSPCLPIPFLEDQLYYYLPVYN